MKTGGHALTGLVGAGGFGREVMPLLRVAGQAGLGAAERLVFVSDDRPPGPVNGVECLTPAEFFAVPAGRRSFNVAVGSPVHRRRMAEDFLARGGVPRSIFAPTVRVLDAVTIGDGAILCDFTVVTANAVLGRFVHLNLHAYVAHDCVVGDYVTMGPGAKVNGNVHIEDGVIIGAGASIINGSPGRPLRIGAGATVGMGAVVISDVPPGVTVVGSPARVASR